MWAAVGQRRVKRAISGVTAPLHRNTLATSSSQCVCSRYRQLWLAAAAPPSPSMTRRDAAEAARLSPQYQQKEIKIAIKVYIRHRYGGIFSTCRSIYRTSKMINSPKKAPHTR